MDKPDFFLHLDQMTASEWLLWILLGIWAFGTIVVIACDVSTVIEDSNDGYSFTNFFKESEYRVVDILFGLLAIPAWIIEGVGILLWKLTLLILRLLDAVLSITVIKRKTDVR